MFPSICTGVEDLHRRPQRLQRPRGPPPGAGQVIRFPRHVVARFKACGRNPLQDPTKTGNDWSSPISRATYCSGAAFLPQQRQGRLLIDPCTPVLLEKTEESMDQTKLLHVYMGMSETSLVAIVPPVNLLDQMEI